jgi:pimeloyl-ACP methyl ester carboxylesterase
MRPAKQNTLCAAILCISFMGCGQPIGIRTTNDEKWFIDSQRSALNSEQLSDLSQQTIRQLDLVEEQRHHSPELIEELIGELKQSPSRQLTSVLAEICYLQGKQNSRQLPKSLPLYASAARLAYAFLFDDGLGEAASAYDPRFRQACDIYNRSLAKLVMAANIGQSRWGDPLHFESILGPIQVTYGLNEMAWGAGSFHKIRTVYEFEPVGFRNQFRKSGLGVPLVGLRHPTPPEHRTPQDQFLPHQADQAYGATFVMRFETSLIEALGSNAGHRGVIDIFDPMKTIETEIAGRSVSLETDVTTPLAYALENAPPVRGTTGLLDVKAWDDLRGLYMLHPFEKDKIPVVFVHGLIGTPQTWLQMVNDLLGDVQFREHYQIWYFMYPTGNPVLYSAAFLRAGLLEARRVFDPEKNNPAFDRTVIVGHSMGGILSQFMVKGSEDRLWNVISDRPFDDLKLDAQESNLLKRVLFFDAVPFISRAIFLAAPHRGSSLADAWFASLGSNLIKLPSEVVNIGHDLAKVLQKSDKELADKIEGGPNSVYGLSPENPILKAMVDTPIDARVTYHSIIGNHKEANVPGTDGIVPYESAHLEGAESEIIIHSGHSMTANPIAIREVRRILMEHVAASK